MGPGRTLDASARFLGHLRWLEARCFEVVGGWVPTTVDPGLKVLFARCSTHHAWRAELLARCLPETRDHDPDRLTAPPSPEWDRVVAEWRDQLDPSARVAVLVETLLPALITGSERWLAQASPIRDAVARRWVTLVLADQRADADEVAAQLPRGMR